MFFGGLSKRILAFKIFLEGFSLNHPSVSNEQNEITVSNLCKCVESVLSNPKIRSSFRQSEIFLFPDWNRVCTIALESTDTLIYRILIVSRNSEVVK